MPRLATAFITGRIKQIVAQQFTDTCLVEVRAVGVGVYGEPFTGWTTVSLSMPCRITRTGSRMKSAAALVGEAISIRDSYRIIYPTTYTLSVAMRITTRDGLRYDVDSLQENDTDSVMNEAFITRQIGDQP
jgi:hypothetical protein